MIIAFQDKVILDFYNKEQEKKQRHRLYNQKVMERGKKDPSFLRIRKF